MQVEELVRRHHRLLIRARVTCTSSTALTIAVAASPIFDTFLITSKRPPLNALYLLGLGSSYRLSEFGRHPVQIRIPKPTLLRWHSDVLVWRLMGDQQLQQYLMGPM